MSDGDELKALAGLAEKGVNTVLTASPSSEPNWAKPVVALFAMVLLAGMVIYAVILKDHEIMLMAAGAIISMATGAGNFYLGSSSGSERKTDLLAAAPPITKPS